MKQLFYFSILISIFVFNCAAAALQSFEKDKNVPVLVELFTAEGCSSCPSADKYFQTLLDKQPVSGVEIIGLSEHVDYWNQLGWIDRFSAAQFSNRQKYYAAFFKRTDIFTPQFVVDGVGEITPKNGLKSLAEYSKSLKGVVNLSIGKITAETVSFDIKISDLPKISDGDKAVVVLALTENNLVSEVSSGENIGQKLKHTAVVRYLKTVGEIENGGETKLAAETAPGNDWKRGDLSAVVFVQEAASRRILGAAKINFN